MAAAMWVVLILYLFRKELQAWVVETLVRAHIEGEKRRMAMYEEGFGEPEPCCDNCAEAVTADESKFYDFSIDFPSNTTRTK